MSLNFVDNYQNSVMSNREVIDLTEDIESDFEQRESVLVPPLQRKKLVISEQNQEEVKEAANVEKDNEVIGSMEDAVAPSEGGTSFPHVDNFWAGFDIEDMPVMGIDPKVLKFKFE